jgi:hypothetical protein
VGPKQRSAQNEAKPPSTSDRPKVQWRGEDHVYHFDDVILVAALGQGLADVLGGFASFCAQLSRLRAAINACRATRCKVPVPPSRGVSVEQLP